MIDVLAVKRKYNNPPDFDADKQLVSYSNNMCIPQEDEISLSLIAPMQQDGTYHSDMASSDKQPQLLQRVKQLPRNFAPRGLDDEDIINACGSRSLHDIADINNVSENVLDNVPRTAAQVQGVEPHREDNSGNIVNSNGGNAANSTD